MMVGKRRLLHIWIGFGLVAASLSGIAAVRSSTSTRSMNSGEAQSCPHIPSGGGEDLTPFMTKSDGSCTVEDGSYVRTWTTYKLHVVAEAYGQCTMRGSDCSPLPCTCVTTGTQLRRPAGVGIRLYNTHPLSPFSIGPIYPNDNSLQLWDSRVTGQTSPPGRTWSTGSTLGQATLRFTEVIITTACEISPSEKVVERTAYVLQCEPQFLDTHLAVPTPPDKVQIYLDPSTMSSATIPLEEAIQNWNDNLTGTGMNFERTGTDCGTGPRCIKVVPASISSCGFAAWSSDPKTGLLTGHLQIQLHPDWATFSAASLRRTFVHEIGHFLGLDNYGPASGCGVDDAMMRDDFVCGPSSSPGVSLTGSDALPAAKSTYGGGPKTACGW
jgi:hypothetical protein